MKLGLGTVQFGMDYGISNSAGQVSDDNVRSILKIAAENNLEVLDTAAEYGSSEKTLGQLLPPGHNFKIVTKGLTTDLMDSFYRSLDKLKQKKIYGYLIHDVQNLTRHGGTKLFNEVRHLKERGVVSKIGVSVYNALEIDRVLELSTIDIIQLPLNLLDQRLLRSGHLKKLKNQGIEIHVRSAFLQGLLLMPLEQLPENFSSVKGHLKAIYELAQKQDLSVLELSLGFLLNTPEVDQVVVGAVSPEQVFEIISAAQNAAEHVSVIENIASQAVWHNENILNPSLWKKNA